MSRHLPKIWHESHLTSEFFRRVTAGPVIAISRSKPDVTLKIDKSLGPQHTTIRLIGRVRAEHLAGVEIEMKKSGPRIALDLDEVTLVDVDVVRFLNKCELEGVVLLNCAPYVREWMNREQNRSQA